jgi:hypothetical protein
VFTTYQRNIQSSREDKFDDFFGDDVGGAEIQAGDDDEPEHDGGRLRDVAAVGPLNALQLGPARANERDGAVPRGQRSAGRTR